MPLLRQSNKTASTQRESLFDPEEFDFEHERAVGRDLGAGAVLAVSQVRGTLEFELVADFHELESLDPAGDNPGEGKADGLPAFNGAVKNGAVQQCAVVMHLYDVRRLG